MSFSPTDLTYFLEVSHTLNLSRAAERLGIRQPSLTLAIQRLEDSLGAKILIRNPRGVTLTQAGKQLLIHSKKLLEYWDQVKGQALASMNEIQGMYTLGCHPSVALYTLPKILPQLLKKHTHLEVTLHHDLSRKIVEGVISSKIDIGIVVNPIRHPDLIVKKLYDDKVTLWSNRKKQTQWESPTDQDVLICDPNLVQTQALIKNLRKKGFQFTRMVPSVNLEVIRELTLKGCGVGILPARVALTGGGKKLRPLTKAPIFRDEICLVYRVENRSVRSIQVFSEAIQSCFEA